MRVLLPILALLFSLGHVPAALHAASHGELAASARLATADGASWTRGDLGASETAPHDAAACPECRFAAQARSTIAASAPAFNPESFVLSVLTIPASPAIAAGPAASDGPPRAPPASR